MFRLALRQTEGLIGSILQLLDLPVPDHSTLSRRAETLKLPKPRSGLGCGPVHLLVDSTGLRLCGPGEWLIETSCVRLLASNCEITGYSRDSSWLKIRYELGCSLLDPHIGSNPCLRGNFHNY